MDRSVTIAPSEAHLEQWVFSHLPKFGEYREDGEFMPYMDSVNGVQYPLPSGIADMVGKTRVSAFPLCAVELKKTELNTRALAQVLRYMNDLSHLVDLVRESEYMKGRYTSEQLHQLFWRRNVSGLLVGHRIEDTNLLYACAKCDVHVALYTFDGEGYTFKSVTAPTSKWALNDRELELHTPLIDTILDILQDRMLRIKGWSTQ